MKNENALYALTYGLFILTARQAGKDNGCIVNTVGQVTISPKAHNVESGFLLVYGGVDINCTFRAIFEDAYEQLRDTAGRLLFPQA